MTVVRWTGCLPLASMLTTYSTAGVPAAAKIAIVTPSGLVGNWKAEFNRWLGKQRLEPCVVNGVGKEAEAAVDTFVTSHSNVAPVIIVSYEVW
jgi:hypothetical protein